MVTCSGRYRETVQPLPSRGAVLLLALVFMLMLAMVAGTVMQAAILQLHMAGNDQFFEEALQKAQAIADEMSLNADNFALQGEVGDVNCPPDAQDAQCSRTELQVPVSAHTAEGKLEYRVRRQEPLWWRGFVLREAESAVSSSRSFDTALFEIDVHIDGSARRLGSARVIQGIALRVPAVD